MVTGKLNDNKSSGENEAEKEKQLFEQDWNNHPFFLGKKSKMAT